MAKPDAAPVRIAEAALRDYVAAIFAAAGSEPREAGLIADHLVAANLAGHDSHGVGMLPAYIRNVGLGELKLNQRLSTALDTGGLILCDAARGAGQVMGHDAMALGIARARETGLCLVGLRDSHHIGRIGTYAEQAVAAGLVSLHFVNVVSEPAVAPFGGRSARVGTNPIAIGIPRDGEPPIVVDFATSRWAVGKVRVANNKGEPVPPGTLLDAEGQPTLDASALFASPKGALLPFGEHKGWCLSLAAELLGAALIGGPVQSHPKADERIVNSMLTILISPERLGTAPAFQDSIGDFAAWVRDGGGEVLLPGEPERARRAERQRDGIPVDPVTWAQIVEAAESVGCTARPEARG
jgi:hydroxycarboxylate dehydrogenase B